MKAEARSYKDSVVEKLRSCALYPERILKRYALKNFLNQDKDGYKIPLLERGIEIEKPADVIENLREEYRSEMRECFGAVMLSTRRRVIDDEIISIGSLELSVAVPREVYRPAVKASAASVILIHNHPSGDPEPSYQDIEAAERLKRAGEVLGIELLDFLIYGNEGYTSLKEKGLL